MVLFLQELEGHWRLAQQFAANSNAKFLVNVEKEIKKISNGVWWNQIKYYFPNGVFTLTDTKTDTRTDKLAQNPVGADVCVVCTLPHKTHFCQSREFGNFNFVFQDSERYLFDNRVRIRDIELVTGLGFLTANRTLESVRTRTAAYPNRWIPASSWHWLKREY